MDIEGEEIIKNRILALSEASEDGGGILYAADARETTLFHVLLTLGVAALHKLDIPTGSRGFRLTTSLTDVIFAIDEDPAAAIATSSGTDLTEANYGVGNIASDSEREVRIADGDELRIKSATGGAITVEFFG